MYISDIIKIVTMYVPHSGFNFANAAWRFLRLPSHLSISSYQHSLKSHGSTKCSRYSPIICWFEQIHHANIHLCNASINKYKVKCSDWFDLPTFQVAILSISNDALLLATGRSSLRQHAAGIRKHLYASISSNQRVAVLSSMRHNHCWVIMHNVVI